jgi:hypothetical protein
MEDIIKLSSRHGATSYLRRLKPIDNEDKENSSENENKLNSDTKPKEVKESKTYALKSDASYIRVGNTDEGKVFIDPYGGPMIIVGEALKGTEFIVKSIDFIQDYGYVITFE